MTLPIVDSSGRLGPALVISLFLHLLVLWPSPPARQVAVPASPLHAVLRPVSAPVVPAAVSAVQPSPPRAPDPERKPASPRTMAAIENELPNIAPSQASTAGRNFGSEAAPEPIPTGSTAQTPSALLPEEGLDAEGLRGYRLALAREMKRYRRYPSQAVDAGWEGTVEVEVRLGVGGIAQGVRLARSSGHAALDEAALAMLAQALPATPVPATLRERNVAVSLSVVFELPR